METGVCRTGAGGGRGRGMLVTAVEVTDDPDDHSQLVPMLGAAEETTKLRSEMTLADAGYHSGSDLAEYGLREQQVVMPEAQDRALGRPYHKDRFAYDQETDSYICPQGQRLRLTRIKGTRGIPMRLYRASGAVCRGCPAFGVCTRDSRHGRGLEIGPYDTALRRHYWADQTVGMPLQPASILYQTVAHSSPEPPNRRRAST